MNLEAFSAEFKSASEDSIASFGGLNYALYHSLKLTLMVKCLKSSTIYEYVILDLIREFFHMDIKVEVVKKVMETLSKCIKLSIYQGNRIRQFGWFIEELELRTLSTII